VCSVNSLKFANLFTVTKLNPLSRFKAASVDVDKLVGKPTAKPARKSLDVRIDDVWFDLSGWRLAHPAGDHWIDLYSGRDATEVMHGFHSEKGRTMLLRLPKSQNAEALEKEAAPVSNLTRNFRAFRNKLETDGWWKRDLFHEFRLISIWAALFFGGTIVSHSQPLLAVVLLALANTSAGWIGHDYIHGENIYYIQ